MSKIAYFLSIAVCLFIIPFRAHAQPAPSLQLYLDNSLTAVGTSPKHFRAPRGVDIAHTATNGYASFLGYGEYLESEPFTPGENSAEQTTSFWIRPTVASPNPSPSPSPASQQIVSRGEALDVRLEKPRSATPLRLFGYQGFQGANSILRCPFKDAIVPQDGRWHQIALTKDRLGTAQTFLDGALVGASGCKAVGDLKSAVPLRIGGVDAGYDGGFDQLTLFPTVLSAQDIATVYQAERRLVEPSANLVGLINYQNLLSLITLDSKSRPIRALNFGFSGERTTALFKYDAISGLPSQTMVVTGHVMQQSQIKPERNILLGTYTYAAADKLATSAISIPPTSIFRKIDREGIFGRTPLTVAIDHAANFVSLSGIQLAPKTQPKISPSTVPGNERNSIITFRSPIYCADGRSICPGPEGSLELQRGDLFGAPPFYYPGTFVPSVSSTANLELPTSSILFDMDGVASTFTDPGGAVMFAKQVRNTPLNQLITCWASMDRSGSTTNLTLRYYSAPVDQPSAPREYELWITKSRFGVSATRARYDASGRLLETVYASNPAQLDVTKFVCDKTQDLNYFAKFK